MWEHGYHARASHSLHLSRQVVVCATTWDQVEWRVLGRYGPATKAHLWGGCCTVWPQAGMHDSVAFEGALGCLGVPERASYALGWDHVHSIDIWGRWRLGPRFCWEILPTTSDISTVPWFWDL